MSVLLQQERRCLATVYDYWIAASVVDVTECLALFERQYLKKDSTDLDKILFYLSSAKLCCGINYTRSK
jgi:hypothetical protein